MLRLSAIAKLWGPPPSPPPVFDTAFIWPASSLMADVTTTRLTGTTADGTYLASASSNTTFAWQAYDINAQLTWTSSPAYTGATYNGNALTNAVAGEWIQLVFPEPFRPLSLHVQSNALPGALFGSADGGATWAQLTTNSLNTTDAAVSTPLSFDALRYVLTGLQPGQAAASVSVV